MDPWSKKTLRSHELWTQTSTVGLFSRLWSPVVCFFGVAADRAAAAAAALRRRLELRNKGGLRRSLFGASMAREIMGCTLLFFPWIQVILSPSKALSLLF
jgi:hypothetical protein